MAKRGTIDDFKANVASDFARPNLFQVDLAFPSGILQNADLVNLGKFTVRAANLPSSQIGVIEVPFRGRTLKIAGDRTFEPWTITVMNDSKFVLRTAFELWMNSISRLENNTGATNPASYMATAFVHQLGRGASQGRHSTQNSDTTGGTGITPMLQILHFIFFSIIHFP